MNLQFKIAQQPTPQIPEKSILELTLAVLIAIEGKDKVKMALGIR